MAPRKRRMDRLLRVENLKTHFSARGGIVRAVDGVTFSVAHGEVFGLVGESGCGKSITLRSILRLVPPPGRIVDGHIFYQDEDILTLPESELRSYRGAQVAMIFQDPGTALNPVLRVGYQIYETLREHHGLAKQETRDRAVELLSLVGMPAPELRLAQYPHELSGGMRQRAMIAIALACNPKLLLADEPTTALDVTLQDQVLRLITDLQEQLGMSVIWVTHDFGVIAMICKRAGVMYAGKLLEIAEIGELLAEPRHPYTVALLESIPKYQGRGQTLMSIPGSPPDMRYPPSGCSFHPRCQFAIEECRRSDTPLREVSPGHFSSCMRVGEIWK